MKRTMAYQALLPYTDPQLSARFVSNIDGADVVTATADLDPAQTLFVVSSKGWQTLETLTNARAARQWIQEVFGGDTAATAPPATALSDSTPSRLHDVMLDWCLSVRLLHPHVSASSALMTG
jgi:glucose-6-phosphate isomerase